VGVVVAETVWVRDAISVLVDSVCVREPVTVTTMVSPLVTVATPVAVLMTVVDVI
jgi:hypothetical protein